LCINCDQLSFKSVISQNNSTFFTKAQIYHQTLAPTRLGGTLTHYVNQAVAEVGTLSLADSPLARANSVHLKTRNSLLRSNEDYFSKLHRSNNHTKEILVYPVQSN
jgi:hypothetical protein